MSNANKVSFRYNHLDSFTDAGMSNSTSALRGPHRRAARASWTYQNSNYQHPREHPVGHRRVELR